MMCRQLGLVEIFSAGMSSPLSAVEIPALQELIALGLLWSYNKKGLDEDLPLLCEILWLLSLTVT